MLENKIFQKLTKQNIMLKVSFKNIDWFQKYKALKSKIVKKAQFHKENGIKKLFSTSKLCISETGQYF